uniref:Uncharacterized protein n=1 Tax=uncultured marine virus TaxID=186617 RepID=A0A0F7L601_9VIRU|nr:hypothetical protein [uncultured marine virus]
MFVDIKLNYVPGELSKDNPYFEEYFDMKTGVFKMRGQYVVCGRCRGAGSHVNPSIDGNGLTNEELHHDPDFAEAYFSGVYDIPCLDCQGDRVIPEIIPALSRFDLEVYKSNQQLENDQAEIEAAHQAEIRMGA